VGVSADRRSSNPPSNTQTTPPRPTPRSRAGDCPRRGRWRRRGAHTRRRRRHRLPGPPSTGPGARAAGERGRATRAPFRPKPLGAVPPPVGCSARPRARPGGLDRGAVEGHRGVGPRADDQRPGPRRHHRAVEGGPNTAPSRGGRNAGTGAYLCGRHPDILAAVPPDNRTLAQIRCRGFEPAVEALVGISQRVEHGSMGLRNPVPSHGRPVSRPQRCFSGVVDMKQNAQTLWGGNQQEDGPGRRPRGRRGGRSAPRPGGAPAAGAAPPRPAAPVGANQPPPLPLVLHGLSTSGGILPRLVFWIPALE